MLNPIDRSLFDALLEAGYLLQLVPVKLTLPCNWSDGFYDLYVNQANFIPKAFIKHAGSGEMETVIIDENLLVADHSNRITYVTAMKEDKRLLSEFEAAELTGNESAEGRNEYFACAIVVRAAEMRAALEKNK